MADRSRLLRRYVVIVLVATVIGFTGWGMVRPYLTAPSGDFETREGDILLSDGKFDAARARFEAALAENPDHPGAMMGRAIALMQSGRTTGAEAAFTALIAVEERKFDAENATRRGLLAAAYANRGILNDRAGRPERALADYRRALAIDAEAVAGPGLTDRVLYGTPNAATVAKRADYLAAQLELPPEDRVLTRPRIDAEQRMHKP